MKQAITFLIFVFFLFLVSTPLLAQFKVAQIFSNNMVLQRNQPIKVWGWAAKGAKVEIQFQENDYSAETDEQGNWLFTLPKMEAGGPYTMTIQSGENQIQFENILIGDVWLCSGQSNMEWTVANSADAKAEIAKADDNQIRHFKVPLTYSNKPEKDLAGGLWEVTSSETVADFTAVGYYFARELREHQNVPIGLLNSSWGGSRIEPWMSAGTLNMDNVEDILEEAKTQAEKAYQERMEKIKVRFPRLSTQDAGMKDGEPIWAKADLEEEGWQLIQVPTTWEHAGYEGFDGVAWYRTSFELTEKEAAQNITLGVGKIDDSDITWVNGQKVGGMEQAWDKDRVYEVEAAFLKPGKNTISIRVEDTGGGGGIYGDAALVYVKTSQRTISLAGNWKFNLGSFLSNTFVFHPNQLPTILYNKMIFPIKNYAITGALWYQGESNAGSEKEAYQYRQLLPDMIANWRSDWGIGDFPFLYVQLANFLAPDAQPVESNWALIRESQTAAGKAKNTAQAVIIDIGEADDIHPRNKQDVGLRLSLAARKLAYNEDIVYSSPVYKKHEIKGGKILVSFDHIGEGLMVKNKYGYVNGFAIAGADKKFVWAKATLKGDKVMVWNEKITTPEHIRYAWGNNPDDVNLYNSANLPATPFRTDKTAIVDYSLFEKKQYQNSKGEAIPYRILYPKDYDKSKKYPLVLFLHGAGERGNDNEAQLVHGVKLFLQENNRTEFPCIVLAPQCPAESYWSSADVDRNSYPVTLKFDYEKMPITEGLKLAMELTQKTINEEAVDENRVYITGLSMGGMGTFEAQYRFPKLFAAAAPVCGGGDEKNYKKKHTQIPFWIFHGDADNVVKVEQSRTMYSRLKELGANVKYTEYPDVGHNSWDNAYGDKKLLEWMFKAKR